MADIKSEQIMAAAFTALDAVATFTTFRAPLETIELADFPAVALYMGEDDPRGEDGFDNIGFYEGVMVLNCDCYVEKGTTNIESALNAVRKAAHIAIMADSTLGLSFVLDTKPIGADEPELSVDGERIVATMRVKFQVEYRANATDLST